MLRFLVLGHFLVLAGCGCSTAPSKLEAQVKCANTSAEWVLRQKAYALCNQKIGCRTDAETMYQMAKTEARMTAACTDE